ncbi:hypothetical protein GOBAR_DD02618 [Gossypium barbadense]|nr:hypothetical protein GOBAR_DD02618 [Gossypium barbadense]
MSGGPYCRPKHWRRNTAIAMFGVFLICIPIAMKSTELEVEGARRMVEVQLGGKFNGGGPVRWEIQVFYGYLGSIVEIAGICWVRCLLAGQRVYPARPLRSSNDRGLGEQRPHQPVRPIPSQLWCKNFGNKDY